MTIVNKTNTTIYSTVVDTVNKAGTNIYNPPKGSTLNEKYNIHPITEPTDIPQLKYYGIGLSPIPFLDISELDLYRYKHSPTSIDLFRPVPFLVRDINIGLTKEEEDTYRMRIVKQIGAKTYIICYLKVLDIKDTEPTISKFELSDSGKYIATTYNPDTDATKTIPVDNDSNVGIGVSQNIRITLTETEIANIKSAVALLYPDLSTEMVGQYIWELAIYHGIDKPYSTGIESAKTQPAYFIQRPFSLSDTSFDYILNIGGMTPRVFG